MSRAEPWSRSPACEPSEVDVRGGASDGTHGRSLAGVVVVASAALLAGCFPLGASIAIVFLLAGPHNWFEARYMLGRLPARLGPLRGYFLWGASGVVGLSAAFMALPWAAERGGWSDAAWSTAIGAWNTAFLVWTAAAMTWRARQPPRRDWAWGVPAALTLVGLNWLHPVAWSLLLVYAHPILALWFLDRELRRRRSPWLASYRRALAAVPAAVVALVVWRGGAPDLPGDDVLSAQIVNHAGGGVIPRVSTHCLVAIHVFLELLHYVVWIVALPLASGAVPWRPADSPLGRRSPAWKRAVTALAAAGAVVVVALWGAFLADYPLARDVYFTIALVHVLAEIPFLLRLL